MMPEFPTTTPDIPVPPIIPADASVVPAPAAAVPPEPAEPPVAASTDARRVASTILEVLAGVRSITDAAVALGVAPARYYVLEARALAGLIAACEPRSPGPHAGNGLTAEIARLRAERDRLRDEAARYQALARMAQAAFIPAGTAAAAAAAAAGGTTRKKRTATVRAVRLARQV